MLKRVGSALAKFIAPISSSSGVSSGDIKSKPQAQDFKKFKREDEEPEQDGKEYEQEATSQEDSPKDDSPTVGRSKVHALESGFIHLMNRLIDEREKISGQAGKREYIEKKGNQQKKMKVRKGAMVNRKVE